MGTPHEKAQQDAIELPLLAEQDTRVEKATS